MYTHILTRTYTTYALLGLLALLVLLYGFFVRQTVLHVVERRQMEQEMALLISDVAELESRYSTLQEGLTLARAAEQGLYEATQVFFVSRAPDAPGVALLDNNVR